MKCIYWIPAHTVIFSVHIARLMHWIMESSVILSAHVRACTLDNESALKLSLLTAGFMHWIMEHTVIIPSRVWVRLHQTVW